MAAIAMLWASLLPASVAAQTSEAVGVVTTLDGRATVARPALPSPLALKFKDDVFGRDRISTEEKSLVRVLLGGKAILTVRELSQITIHEEPGRAVVTLPDGKVVLAVQKQRMRPGESIEIRTPNAVAAVRGSLMAVSFSQGSTSIICGSGDCLHGVPGQPLSPLQPGEKSTDGQVGPASQADMNAAFNFRTGTPTFTSPPQSLQTALIQQQTAQATTVAQFVSTGTVGSLPQGGPTAPSPSAGNAAPLNSTSADPFQPGQVPGASPPPSSGNPPPPPPPSGGPKTNVLANSGFETSLAPTWSSTGAVSIIGNLGSIQPPEGEGMAILHTGFGAVPVAQLPSPLNLAANRPATAVNGSVLSQSFTVSSGDLFTVKVTYNFLSNEFPTFFAGGQSTVNDTFRSFLIDPSGQKLDIAQASLNGSFPSGVSPETATAANFTIAQGNGVTGFNTVIKQWVPEGTGASTLFFDIYNLGDAQVFSAALVDAVAVGQDPPLYLLRRGDSLVRTTTDPLLRLAGSTGSFDSLMVVCCEGRASLAGPLLSASDSSLTVPWSLLAVLQGGVVTTSSTDPLARLEGGSYSFGSSGVPMFDLYGVSAAVDPETGLLLGTHRPLQHGGSLLQTSNATVSATQAVRVDNALLEASAPLLALTNGSSLATAADTVALSYQAKVTSLGSIIALDRSALTVANGAALSLAGGSVLRVTGDLFSLANGSTLSVLNGPLVSLTGGSILKVNGALVGFGGAGGNVVSVSNSFCPCTTIGGIPVSLTGGALASNVSIAGAVKNGALGSVNLSPNAALIRVHGAGTKVTISGL
jgi:hypothetical protein